MNPGDLVELHYHVGVGLIVKDPKIMKFAGLVAEVMVNGKIRKIALNDYIWDRKRKMWRRDGIQSWWKDK